MAASVAQLRRRKDAIGNDQSSPRAYRLILDHAAKRAEGNVGKRPGKTVVLCHASDVKVSIPPRHA